MADAQNEMLQRITRVETVVESMDEKLDRALTVNEMAVEARASASSAHKRLDKIEESQRWLWRTVAAALITGVIGGAVAIMWQALSK